MAQEPRKYILVPTDEFVPEMLQFAIQKDQSLLRVCRFAGDPKQYYLLKWRQGNPEIFRKYDKKNINQIAAILVDELNEKQATQRILNGTV